jgi:hypothetical protein
MTYQDTPPDCPESGSPVSFALGGSVMIKKRLVAQKS